MHILAAQLAANNCYTDVKLAFVYDRRKEGRGESWECMKWLPHVWSEDKKIRYFASNPLEAGDVFLNLPMCSAEGKKTRETKRAPISSLIMCFCFRCFSAGGRTDSQIYLRAQGQLWLYGISFGGNL